MWFKTIQDRLFSRVKAVLVAKYGATYTNLNVTRNKAIYEKTQLPTVYLEFKCEERGTTLDNTGVNAVEMTIQVKVVATAEQGIDTLETLSFCVMQTLKEAQFNMSMPGLSTDEGDSKALISTYKRIIGANDII